MSDISEILQQRYGEGGQYGQEAINRIESLWTKFRPLATKAFLRDFRSGQEHDFQGRYWEMHLGCFLLDQGLQPIANDLGPDFKIERGGQTLWIEATAPDAGNGADMIPSLDLQTDLNNLSAHDVPEVQMLLRYTNAVNAKYMDYCDYLKDERIAASDVYIIAINSIRLGFYPFMKGDIPVVLHALYPVGHMQVHINLKEPKAARVDYQYRRNLSKANASPVATDFFLKPESSGISAVLAARINPDGFKIPPDPFVAIHNKTATNLAFPLPFKVDREYIAKENRNEIEIHRIKPAEQEIV